MEEASAPKKSRSGSETRQREQRVTVRFSEKEYALLEVEAERTGHTLAAYVRAKVLGKEATTSRIRSQYRPSVEVETLCRLQGGLNKAGGNIQQLVKLLRFGGTPTEEEMQAELSAALNDYRQAVWAIMEALGRGKRE